MAQHDDLRVSVKRWRDGSWAAAAIDEKSQTGTLVESNGKSAARVIVLSPQRAVEVTLQPVLYSRGLGRALIAASMTPDGSRHIRANRIFPNSVIRNDDVQRRGSQGQRRTTWSFPNASFIVSQATQDSQHIRLLNRHRQVTQTRVTKMVRQSASEVAFQVTVSDAAGNVTGRISGTTRIGGGRKSRVMEGTGTSVSTRSEMGDDFTSKYGTVHYSTRTPDGNTQVADGQYVDNKTYVYHETDIDSSGHVIHDSTSVAQLSDDGTTTTTNTTITTLADGSTHTNTSTFTNSDGVFTTVTDDPADGNQRVTTQNDDGTSSRITVDYSGSGVAGIPDGGCVITIVSTDSDGTVYWEQTTLDAQGGEVSSDSGSTPADGGDDTDPSEPPSDPPDPPDDSDPGGDPPAPDGNGDNGGMPSDCGTDEGPRIGGTLNGSGGGNALGTLGDVGRGGPGQGGGTGDPGDPGEEYPGVFQGLMNQVQGGGMPSGGSRGDGGWGDDGSGSEGPPTVKFSGGGHGSMLGLGGRTQTEDWGDLNNPRALIGFAAAAFGVVPNATVRRAAESAVSI